MDIDKKAPKKLKDEMPKTAEWVAEKRKEWGSEHVTNMVKAAHKGEKGCCYAVERIGESQYKTFGAPFDWDAKDLDLIGRCMMLGLDFIGVMKPPKGFSNGTN